MKYKYKKGQILGKRLDLPKEILSKVYDCSLTFNEYISYNLDDKIPITCISFNDRRIIEKFGLEKAKNLDWELLENDVSNHFRVMLMDLDSKINDINQSLYELVKDKIKPINYSPKMKEVYKDRLFQEEELTPEMKKFNEGTLSLNEIIENWNLYKDKDLSYCLLNKKEITKNNLKTFMGNFGNVLPLIFKVTNNYDFINEIMSLNSLEEQNEKIKIYTDKLLNKTYKTSAYFNESIQLTNDQYKEVFNYSSLEEHLKKFSQFKTPLIMEELKKLEPDYIFNNQIPFKDLCNSDVLDFIGTFGLKNIVDFDNECGHYFTNNNSEMLKLTRDMYMHFAEHEYDQNKYIYTKNSYDENGNYVERPYTKEEFYEAMRRMILYGPTDPKLRDKAPNYSNITGEFRAKNKELFISEQAPVELQKLFYTKSITPQLIKEHPEYIQFLNDKDLSTCFKPIYVDIKYDSNINETENFYSYICNKMNLNDSMKFITEYVDIFDIVFKDDMYNNNVSFLVNDNIDDIQRKIHESFKNNLIENRIAYPTNIPESIKENYPSMFLSNDAPNELKDAFYNRTINSNFILSNPTYINYLKNVDLELIYKYMPVKIENEVYKHDNLVNILKNTFGNEGAFNVMLLYDEYIEKIFDINRLKHFKLNSNLTKDKILDELDSNIYQSITNDNMKYDDKMPMHFKNNNPTLFLKKDLPIEIRNKFYNREFTIKDFESNPELLEMFGSTNVVCGFNSDVSWMIQLFDENNKKANSDRLKILSSYEKINDVALQENFKEYILESANDINLEKIDYVQEVLSRLSLSNSSEIFTFRKQLATQILNSDNPIENLEKIEDKFIKNHIPTVGKIYSCFEILHPDFEGFNFNSSTISPMLKKSSVTEKKILVFSDLIKTSFGSNNKSVNSYLKNIESGSNLYESIKSNQVTYDGLTLEQKQELKSFSNHLATLYNNSLKAKNENIQFVSTLDPITDINELAKRLSPDGSLDYNLGDRVTRMFCGFAGISTLEQAKQYINQKISSADARNRETAKEEVKLEQGNFVKGIGNITYLRNILQNGSVSKEFLGTSADSDATPLDTDLSMILSSDGTMFDKINETAAGEYGPIWFLIKNDDRFIMSRNNKKEILDTNRDRSKMELFFTGAFPGAKGEGHYGIRTGFASSEINSIITDTYNPKIGLEIALNGFYIPVANMEGKIVFTPNDYDNLRQKMSGLSYYNENKYIFSDNLVTDETEYIAGQIDKSNKEVIEKKKIINKIIESSLDELDLKLKNNIDGDLTKGYVELIDTGSTGRGTNKPGDGDFDYMMRLDKNIYSNPSKLNEIKDTIVKNVGKGEKFEITGEGDFRIKNVSITPDYNVDIDISFAEKTDKISYSTDMALQDRLETIKKQNPEKYKYVVANILLAKQVLKSAEVYKPNRGDNPQGGLGGVGIENWILQNGGSFIDAARSFTEAAAGKDFVDFKSSYYIWDFGDNHLAIKRNKYPHDNFVSENMSESGYNKMTQALKEYINNYNIAKENEITESKSL